MTKIETKRAELLRRVIDNGDGERAEREELRELLGSDAAVNRFLANEPVDKVAAFWSRKMRPA